MVSSGSTSVSNAFVCTAGGCSFKIKLEQQQPFADVRRFRFTINSGLPQMGLGGLSETE